MRRALARAMPDAIVMDLMLPGTDGLSLTREVRSKSDVPILMLSARGEEIDRVVGLEVGADDYLPKPFSPRNSSRDCVRCCAGRTRRPLRSAAASWPSARTGSISQRGRLRRDGLEIELSGAEFDLLKVWPSGRVAF